MPKPSDTKYIAIKPGYTRYADWYLYVTLGMYLSLSLSLFLSLSLSRSSAARLVKHLYSYKLWFVNDGPREMILMLSCVRGARKFETGSRRITPLCSSEVHRTYALLLNSCNQ